MVVFVVVGGAVKVYHAECTIPCGSGFVFEVRIRKIRKPFGSKDIYENLLDAKNQEEPS